MPMSAQTAHMANKADAMFMEYPPQTPADKRDRNSAFGRRVSRRSNFFVTPQRRYGNRRIGLADGWRGSEEKDRRKAKNRRLDHLVDLATSLTFKLGLENSNRHIKMYFRAAVAVGRVNRNGLLVCWLSLAQLNYLGRMGRGWSSIKGKLVLEAPSKYSTAKDEH